MITQFTELSLSRTHLQCTWRQLVNGFVRRARATRRSRCRCHISFQQFQQLPNTHHSHNVAMWQRS